MADMKRCCMCDSIKPIDDFHRNKNQEDGRQTHCKPCKKTYDQRYYKADPKRHQRLVKRWKSSVKEKIDEIKQVSGCLCCGEDSPYCLDFHHLDDKNFAISRAYSSKAWHRILKEIEKCVVLCANCHRKFHAGMFSLLGPRGVKG